MKITTGANPGRLSENRPSEYNLRDFIHHAPSTLDTVAPYSPYPAAGGRAPYTGLQGDLAHKNHPPPTLGPP